MLLLLRGTGCSQGRAYCLESPLRKEYVSRVGRERSEETRIYVPKYRKGKESIVKAGAGQRLS